jgi:shikimate kinase
MVKVIIIGASCSGKTTLVKLLRARTALPVLEIDEELTRLNGGTFPADVQLKHQVLAPQAIAEVLAKESIVFFSNTDYFTVDDLREARKRGFKIVQLEASAETLLHRNQIRVSQMGWPDVSEWFEHMLAYQNQLREQHLVDRTFSTEAELERVVTELLDFLAE